MYGHLADDGGGMGAGSMGGGGGGGGEDTERWGRHSTYVQSFVYRERNGFI
jgi:hypothetical protein